MTMGKVHTSLLDKRDVVNFLKNLGFEVTRIEGLCVTLGHPDTGITVKVTHNFTDSLDVTASLDGDVYYSSPLKEGDISFNKQLIILILSRLATYHSPV